MKRVGPFLAEYGVLAAFLALFLVNAATRGDTFLTPENLRNLVSQSAAVGIIAIGMTLVVMTAGIDLSVGSLVALAGAAALLAMNRLVGDGTDPATALLLASGVGVMVGALAGLLTGATIAYGRVAPFVVTLAGLAGFRSLALVLGDGGEIRSDPGAAAALDTLGFGGVPLPFVETATGGPVFLYWSVLVFLAVALLASFLLNKTAFGRHVIAVGANERAAFYSGIDPRRVKVAAYTFIGALVGVSSILLIARMGSIGTGSVGNLYELDAIAAVVIGGTSLRGGSGRIWGTVVGVLLLTLISNMMTAYRVDTNWQGLVSGAVILIAVLLQRGGRDDR